jgi:hypothetical protein
MAHELELAAGDSMGGFAAPVEKTHAAPPGTPCANCGTVLQGPWCHACGQLGEDFHRSIIRLAGEVIEGLFHLDGRLWRTLPDLMIRPGRLTRAYLEGHRAPQIPPLRLFLVVLLGVFLVGGVSGGTKLVHVNSSTTSETNGKTVTTRETTRTLDELTPAQRDALEQSIGKVRVNIGGDKPNVAATNWLQDRLGRALMDPERFYLVLEQWSERFAILMLPVAALLLSLLFVFQRRFYMFDHTIFALHSLSALGMMMIATMAIGIFVKDWNVLAILPAPVHLFAHMRGVYRTSVPGTLLRMFLLFLGSMIAAGLLVIGLVAVGLNGMGS